MYKNFFKRYIDITLAILLLVFLSPIFLIIMVLIKMDSKGPIFFMQERVGKNMSRFYVYKFRTMTNEQREVGKKPIIGRNNGVTKFGYYLRRLKLDEFPQLLNILKGEMTLVGPRPSIESQLNAMTDQERLRYSVTPGLTGLAQVSGNIHISWHKRFYYDLIYIKNISFLNDLKIILRTFVLVLIGEEKFKDKPLNITRKNENN